MNLTHIKNSLLRLEQTFYGNYGDYPLHEGPRSIGAIYFDKQSKTIYLIFRNSVNSLFEIFSCLFIWKKDLHPLQLQGKVHAGIHGAFQKLSPSLKKPLNK